VEADEIDHAVAFAVLDDLPAGGACEVLGLKGDGGGLDLGGGGEAGEGEREEGVTHHARLQEGGRGCFRGWEGWGQGGLAAQPFEPFGDGGWHPWAFIVVHGGRVLASR